MFLCEYLIYISILVVLVSSYGGSEYTTSLNKGNYNKNGEVPRAIVMLPKRRLMNDTPPIINDIMTFKLYNRDDPEGTILPNIGPFPDLVNATLQTKIIIHGWRSNGSRDSWTGIKDAYLKRDNYNVIIADWSSLSSTYPLAVNRVKDLAMTLAKFIDKLRCHGGGNNKNMHLIGHSMGAHIAGTAGRLLQSDPPARVTGLDPAKPLFDMSWMEHKIANDSADMVDIIHTAAGVFGLSSSLGTVDFYPNGGGNQPGCKMMIIVSDPNCNHRRSWQYFRDSILNDDMFPAAKCNNYTDFQAGNCVDEINYMGDHALPNVTGNHYLDITKYESDDPPEDLE